MTGVLHVTETLERHGGTPRKLLYLVQHGDPSSQRHCFVTFVPGNLDAEMRARRTSPRSRVPCTVPRISSVPT